MALPDSPRVEDYSEEEMKELVELASKDKTKLTKNQKAALARYNFKVSRNEPVVFRAAGAPPPSPPTPPPPSPPKEDESIRILREKALSFPVVPSIRKVFPSDVLDVTLQTDKPCVILSPPSVRKVLRFAKEDLGFTFLNCLTAVDYPPDRIEVVYTLYNFEERSWLGAKAPVSRNDPRLPSVEPLWRGADWLEREVFDLFGVVFEGHPDLRRLLLPEGWVGHPLRKDYDVSREQFVAIDPQGRDLVSFREEEGW